MTEKRETRQPADDRPTYEAPRALSLSSSVHTSTGGAVVTCSGDGSSAVGGCNTGFSATDTCVNGPGAANCYSGSGG